jgi:hypothetical protein
MAGLKENLCLLKGNKIIERHRLFGENSGIYYMARGCKGRDGAFIGR